MPSLHRFVVRFRVQIERVDETFVLTEQALISKMGHGFLEVRGTDETSPLADKAERMEDFSSVK